MIQTIKLLAQGVNLNPEGDLPNLPRTDLTDASIASILQISFGIAGAIALIIIIYSGMRYVLSVGNPEATKKLRNSIIYALIGLIVCIIAFSLVSTVLESAT